MKINVQHIIIFVILAYWGFYGVSLAFVPIPEPNRDMFIGWGTALGGIGSLVAGYYWGQSSTRNAGNDNVDK